MPRSVEVHIGPAENPTGAIDVSTTERMKDRFSDIVGLSGMIVREKWNNTLKIGASLILAADAATELSKAVFPLIPADLTPLNNYPVLAQLSSVSENPLGVGILAMIGTYYLGKDTLRGRARFQAIREGLRQIRINQVDLLKPASIPVSVPEGNPDQNKAA